jgi:hypothetical protein
VCEEARNATPCFRTCGMASLGLLATVKLMMLQSTLSSSSCSIVSSSLPIALSILYVAMAREAAWSVYVLNLAGHMPVQIPEKRPVVMDLVAGGGSFSRQKIAAACQAYLDREGTSALSVVGMTDPCVLARLLNNQAIRAKNESDLHRVLDSA